MSEWIKATVYFAACCALLAQSDKPNRHFHDGEVLKMYGAEITIHEGTAPQDCAEHADGHCTKYVDVGPKLGFFEVHPVIGKDEKPDSIQITVGTEHFMRGLVEGKVGQVQYLSFITYSSSLRLAGTTQTDNAHIIVGEISNLDSIRMITVRLLTVNKEEVFK